MKKNILKIVVIMIILIPVGILITNSAIQSVRRKAVEGQGSIHDYGYYSLQDSVSEAEYIIEARVIKVKKNVVHKNEGSFVDGDGTVRHYKDYTVATPIKVEIKQVIKGNVFRKTMTFYKEVELTDDGIAMPRGTDIKEGMEFILFLNKDRYRVGGPQGMYMVFGDKVNEWNLYNSLDNSELVFEVMNVDQIDSSVWDVKGKKEFNVVDKEYYISLIQSIMDN